MSRDLGWVVSGSTFFHLFFEVLTSGSGSSMSSKIKGTIMILSSGSAYKCETISSYGLSKFLFRMVAGIFMFTEHSISSPPCVIGEQRYWLEVSLASTSVPLSSMNFVNLLISRGRWPTGCRIPYKHVFIATCQMGSWAHDNNLKFHVL